MLGMFFLLIAGHALADFPLQGDYLARIKDHTKPENRDVWDFWVVGLASHAMIHGGFVAVITHSTLLGAIEVVLHAVIDRAKCAGKLLYVQDQLAHVACKVAYVLALCFFPGLKGMAF